MPRNFKVLLAAAAMLVLGAARPALALWPLPWCFTMLPFTDVFVLQSKTSGGNQRGGSGRDLSGFLVDGVLSLGGTIHPQPGYGPVVFGVNVDPDTGTGKGQCHAPTLADCGNFTMQRIVCPGSAAEAAASLQALSPPGPAMGKLSPEE